MEPLPSELLDCVIENLYSDIPSLLSCALVGRAWVCPSQRGIFRDIVLSLPSPLHFSAVSMAYLRTTQKLVASFNSTPRLMSYVRFLELHKFINLHGILDELHAATANVIQQLSTLNHLKFRKIRWIVLSPTLRTALAELFRTPSLTEVTFSGLFGTSLAEVTLLLRQMPRQLKTLHLLSTYLDDPDRETDEEREQDLPAKAIQLKNLTLNCCHASFFMDWFRKDTCPFEVRNLESFHISECEGRDMDGHLHYVGRSLRELELNLFSASYVPDCLTYMPNLRILHLRYFALTKASSPVPMICTIFEPLVNPNGTEFSLQYLKIDLTFDDISQLVAQLDRWVEIDELLDRPEFFPLKRVDVNLSSRECSNWSSAGNALRGKLRILEASRKLYIYYQPHVWR